MFNFEQLPAEGSEPHDLSPTGGDPGESFQTDATSTEPIPLTPSSTSALEHTPEAYTSAEPVGAGPDEQAGPYDEAPADRPEVQEARRLKSEARMFALAEPQPADRLALLDVLITEGEQDVVDFAIAAIQEQPDHDEEGMVNRDKVTGAFNLADALTSQGQFSDAEKVVGILKDLDSYVAVRSITRLLDEGHAGEDGQYLRLDFSTVMEAARAGGRPVPAAVFEYVRGLAAYGEDLSDTTTAGGQLMADSIATVAIPTRRDLYHAGIADAYARGGHIDQAIAVKDIVDDPYWRSSAAVEIAKMVPQDQEALADALLVEAREGLAMVGNCDGTCGRSGCNPALDTKKIEIGMAQVFVQKGDMATARELVGTLELAFAYDQAQVNTGIYHNSGDADARREALNALVQNSVNQENSLTSGIITAIAAADQQWGNTMPSLDADGEAVPLICWELPGLYAQKNVREQRIESEGLDEVQYRGMEMLGVDPSTYLQYIATRRGELRDHGLSSLVKVLASNGAPQTAKGLIGLIETPSEKVRAMVAFGNAVGGP